MIVDSIAMFAFRVSCFDAGKARFGKALKKFCFEYGYSDPTESDIIALFGSIKFGEYPDISVGVEFDDFIDAYNQHQSCMLHKGAELFSAYSNANMGIGVMYGSWGRVLISENNNTACHKVYGNKWYVGNAILNILGISRDNWITEDQTKKVVATEYIPVTEYKPVYKKSVVVFRVSELRSQRGKEYNYFDLDNRLYMSYPNGNGGRSYHVIGEYITIKTKYPYETYVCTKLTVEYVKRTTKKKVETFRPYVDFI